MDCFDTKPLFNVTSKECTSCPKGEKFISSEHICRDPKESGNEREEKKEGE